MTDTTESKPEIAAPAADAAPAPTSETTSAATPTVESTAAAMSASAETPSTTPTPATNAAAADAVLNVAPESSAATASRSTSQRGFNPGSYFARLRPDFGKYTPDFRKFMPSQQTVTLASSLGFACAIGLIIGAGATFGAGHLLDSRAASAQKSSTPNETAALKRSVAQMERQIAALKSSLERASKTASVQTARLSERYDRSAHAQADLQTRIAKIGDSVDRLDKRMTTISTGITGSIAHQQHTASVTPVAVPTPTPAPIPTTVKKPEAPPIVEGWVLRDVFRGRALVESRRGVFEAAPGVPLPGLGQVESIRRQDGQWVVVTDKGLIVAARGVRPHYRYDD